MHIYLYVPCYARNYLNKLSADESLGICGFILFTEVAFSVSLMTGDFSSFFPQSLPSSLVSPNLMDSNRQLYKPDLIYKTSRVADITVNQSAIMRIMFSGIFFLIGLC